MPNTRVPLGKSHNYSSYSNDLWHFAVSWKFLGSCFLSPTGPVSTSVLDCFCHASRSTCGSSVGSVVPLLIYSTEIVLKSSISTNDIDMKRYDCANESMSDLHNATEAAVSVSSTPLSYICVSVLTSFLVPGQAQRSVYIKQSVISRGTLTRPALVDLFPLSSNQWMPDHPLVDLYSSQPQTNVKIPREKSNFSCHSCTV